jgi:hypothetical protein
MVVAVKVLSLVEDGLPAHAASMRNSHSSMAGSPVTPNPG